MGEHLPRPRKERGGGDTLAKCKVTLRDVIIIMINGAIGELWSDPDSTAQEAETPACIKGIRMHTHGEAEEKRGAQSSSLSAV